MRRVQILAGAALAAATAGHAAPTLTTTAPVAVGPLDASRARLPDNALKLSRLVNPEEKILDAGMKGFLLGIDAELKKNPKDAAEYEKNPGLLETVIDAGRPVMRKHLAAIIPVQQQRFAQFYAEKFTPEEIDQLVAFYSSAAGTKVIDAMYAGVDLGALIQASGKDEKSLTAKDVARINGAAAASLPDKFDADDWKTIFVFSATPVHAKLQRLSGEFNQLVADMQNQNDPSLDQEMDAAVQSAVKAYLARRKEKPAG